MQSKKESMKSNTLRKQETFAGQRILDLKNKQKR